MIEKWIKEARSYLGTPWVHQGRTSRGVDCVGFLIRSGIRVGIDITDVTGYSRHPDGIQLKKLMDAQKSFKQVLNTDLKVGDVILLRITREPQHVALVTDSNTSEFGIIHAYNGGSKKVIEHDLVDYWKKRIVAVYRLV